MTTSRGGEIMNVERIEHPLARLDAAREGA
jgi:hypothetical protein